MLNFAIVGVNTAITGECSAVELSSEFMTWLALRKCNEINSQFFSSLKPMSLWVPSQKGLFLELPQRHSVQCSLDTSSP